MNFFTYRISLDIRETTSQAFINVKKNDTARKFIFTLTDNGRAYQITEGCTAVFRAKKPDGTILYNNCPIVGNAMEYYLTSQTVAAVGIVECEITLYGSNSKQITSPRFSLAVDDVLYSDSEVESKDEFTALTGAIDEVRALKAFTIKLTTTSDGITADKTFTEIAEKVNSSKSVIVNMDGWVFPVSYSADSGKIVFSSLWANIAEIPNTVTFAVNSSDVWNVVVSDIPTTAQVSAKYTKPASGIPKADLANDVRTSLDKAETALQEHQSLAAYRTAAAQDVIDGSKQDKLIAGDNITIAADGKTISATGGGGSVPKPLTYDYMPEGYPSKSVQTTVLLEEQEVAFSEVEQDVGVVYAGFLTHPFSLVLGQTYTVNWDGTEYECVASRFQGARADLIGNPSVLGEGEDTGEPFLYGEGMFATLDTSPSHTISVKTSTGTITPMSAEFIPTMNVSAFTNDAGYLTLATLPKYEGVVE